MDSAKKRDIQSVARFFNVFKEQFNLFFSEKSLSLTDTYTFPSFPLVRIREMKGI